VSTSSRLPNTLPDTPTSTFFLFRERLFLYFWPSWLSAGHFCYSVYKIMIFCNAEFRVHKYFWVTRFFPLMGRNYLSNYMPNIPCGCNINIHYSENIKFQHMQRTKETKMRNSACERKKSRRTHNITYRVHRRIIIGWLLRTSVSL
jgi:hypothetical protein